MPNPMMLVPKRCDINNPFKGSTEVNVNVALLVFAESILELHYEDIAIAKIPPFNPPSNLPSPNYLYFFSLVNFVNFSPVIKHQVVLPLGFRQIGEDV